MDCCELVVLQAEKASKLQTKGFVDVIVTFLLFLGLADWTALLSSFLFPKFTSVSDVMFYVAFYQKNTS